MNRPYDTGDLTVEVLDESAYAQMLPHPKKDVNKYSRGTVGVIGGSAAYPGAPIMAAQAASRCGAGYVRLVTVKSAAPCAHMHLLSIPISSCEQGEQETFCAASVEQSLSALAKSDVLLIGPGMGTGKDSEAFLRGVLTDRKTVFDADALTIIARHPELLEERTNYHCVLTPHEGEAARLLGRPVVDRIEDARVLAKKYSATIVLKGPDTVITDSLTTRIVSEGGPELAKAGTGDVLSGMIASFLAQGLDMIDAASLAVFVHGMAGKRIAHEISIHALMPEDIINAIGSTLLSLEAKDFS